MSIRKTPVGTTKHRGRAGHYPSESCSGGWILKGDYGISGFPPLHPAHDVEAATGGYIAIPLSGPLFRASSDSRLGRLSKSLLGHSPRKRSRTCGRSCPPSAEVGGPSSPAEILRRTLVRGSRVTSPNHVDQVTTQVTVQSRWNAKKVRITTRAIISRAQIGTRDLVTSRDSAALPHKLIFSALHFP